MSVSLPYIARNRPPAPSQAGLLVTQDMAEQFQYLSSFQGFSTEEKRLQNFAFVKRFRNTGKRCDKEVLAMER